MSRQYHRLIHNQSRAAVVAQTRDNLVKRTWLLALAAAFAGVFYFFGLFFRHTVERVLAGG